VKHQKRRAAAKGKQISLNVRDTLACAVINPEIIWHPWCTEHAVQARLAGRLAVQGGRDGLEPAGQLRLGGARAERARQARRKVREAARVVVPHGDAAARLVRHVHLRAGMRITAPSPLFGLSDLTAWREQLKSTERALR